MRRQLHGCQPSQVYQPKPLDLLIEADPFRRSEGPLAASSQMLRETTTNVPVDVSEGLAWIPKVEVVLPALQVPVQPLNQLRDRLKALPMIGHLVQLLPLLLQSFRRRTHIQIPPPAPLQVLGVAERESQRVQTRSFFLQIHHPRFLPIDLQPQPAFELRFNPPRQASSLIARHHHEVVGIAHHLGTRPLGWPIGSMKQLVEPMQIHVTEQRRNHPALGTPLARPTPALRLALLTRLYDWGLQPHPDQLEDAPVHHAHAHASQKLLVRNRIEVAFEVRVIHRLIPGLHMTAYLLQRSPEGTPVPSAQDETHRSNPRNPLRRSAPGSTGLPSAPLGRAPSVCPTAAVSHSLSVCRRAVPLSACRSWRAATPEAHPGIPSHRLPTLQSVRSLRRPPRARPDWRAPVSMPLPAYRADRSGRTARKTGTSVPAWPFGSASVSAKRVCLGVRLHSPVPSGLRYAPILP